jgi:hypothetical protein
VAPVQLSTVDNKAILRSTQAAAAQAVEQAEDLA